MATGDGATHSPLIQVIWPRTHRLILSRFPPIDNFDDIVDPRDWALLAAAEARANPRTQQGIGNLGLVPVEHHISGPGASWIRTAFTDIPPDRPSRFSGGSSCASCAGDSLATASQEHSFHMGRFYARTAEKPGWISKAHELVGAIDAPLHDLRGPGYDAALNPEPAQCRPAQAFAADLCAAGSRGIVYPSRCHAGGECKAAFWPDVVTPRCKATTTTTITGTVPLLMTSVR